MSVCHKSPLQDKVEKFGKLHVSWLSFTGDVVDILKPLFIWSIPL